MYHLVVNRASLCALPIYARWPCHGRQRQTTLKVLAGEANGNRSRLLHKRLSTGGAWEMEQMGFLSLSELGREMVRLSRGD